MGIRTLTATNSILLSRCQSYSKNWKQIDGFSADGAFTLGDAVIAETSVGIDGKQSIAYVFNDVDFNITIQADSASYDYFVNIINMFKKNREVDYFEFNIEVPSIGKTYALKGALVSYSGINNAKTLQPIQMSFKVMVGDLGITD